MADVEGLTDGNSEQELSADARDDRVKDSSTDDSRYEPSADAELDDILEGTLN